MAEKILKTVYLDANVILDFLENEDDELESLFKNFVSNFKCSKFCITEYIFQKEIVDTCDENRLTKSNIEIASDALTFVLNPPPVDLDLGEWSIYCKISEEKTGCVLTGDQKARIFFKKKGLLPCAHLNPPPNGIGGTIGILKHFQKTGVITSRDCNRLLSKMLSRGRRLPSDGCS